MNGKRRGRWFNRDVSYVLQDDIHLPTLTVEVRTYWGFGFSNYILYCYLKYVCI